MGLIKMNDIKKSARTKLKDKFEFIIGITIIILILNSVSILFFTELSHEFPILHLYINEILYSDILYDILAKAIIFPIEIAFINILINRKYKYKRIFQFYYPAKFLKSFGIFLITSMPGIFLINLYSQMLDKKMNTCLAIIFGVVGLFFYMVSKTAEYMYIKFNNKSFRYIIKNSYLITIENLHKLIIFDLSFVGWFIIPLVIYLALCHYTFIDYQVNILLFTPLMYGIGIYFKPYYRLCKIGLLDKIIQGGY